MDYDRFLKKGKTLKCPHCKKKKWSYDRKRKVVAFFVENKSRSTDIGGTTPSIHLGLLECRNCGYVKLFSEICWKQDEYNKER